jgi:hypothetical protein
MIVSLRERDRRSRGQSWGFGDAVHTFAQVLSMPCSMPSGFRRIAWSLALYAMRLSPLQDEASLSSKGSEGKGGGRDLREHLDAQPSKAQKQGLSAETTRNSTRSSCQNFL